MKSRLKPVIIAFVVIIVILIVKGIMGSSVGNRLIDQVRAPQLQESQEVVPVETAKFRTSSSANVIHQIKPFRDYQVVGQKLPEPHNVYHLISLLNKG